MVVFRHQNAGQYQSLLIVNKLFENSGNSKYLWTTI